ncbi:hypothetical protein [Dolosigranulum pigrum]|uniref:hypothetical protein n=2 Tax=Dolosigranulum pigrum TaxID=29394 RepID=UPI001FCC4027|nr:hypothetical protein [Dolosigranulum pigrum]
MMLNWPMYTVETAKNDFEKLTVDNCTAVSLNNQFEPLREALLKANDDIFDEYNLDYGNGIDDHKYLFDLNFGLALYKIMNEIAQFSVREATNDDIWRFVSVKVIPDIVHARWGLNKDRYYHLNRRIWLKQLWWYIHLSWRGSVAETKEILKDNTTDTIMNLVERPGLGYNIDLYRELMKQYANIGDSSRQVLRQVMILNTARMKNISPELTPGGIEGYISSLFETVL